MIYNNDFEEFKPVDYYNLAKELSNNISNLNCNSALKRTIISRAYYAAFLQVRQFLKNNGYEFTQRSEHEQVDTLLKKHNPIRNSFFSKDIRTKLYNLKKNRILCDYSFECPDTHNDWSKQSIDDLLSNSKWIIEHVKVDYF